MISFTNAFFLPFFASLIIPFVIHIIVSRAKKKVTFPSTMLLRRVQKRRGEAGSFKDILLLVIRLLILTLLVLILLEIRYTPSNLFFAKRYIIFLDNSPSMDTKKDPKGEFEKAKEVASSFVRYIYELNPSSEVSLISADSSMLCLGKEQSLYAISNLEIAHLSFSLKNSLLKARKYISKESGALLISDCRTDVFSEMEERIDTSIPFMLYKANIPTDDMYIRRVQVWDKLLFASEKQEVSVYVGGNTKDKSVVRMYYNDKMLGLGEVKNGKAVISASFAAGEIPIRLVLDDDKVTSGNTFYTVLSVKESFSVGIYKPNYYSYSKSVGELFKHAISSGNSKNKFSFTILTNIENPSSFDFIFAFPKDGKDFSKLKYALNNNTHVIMWLEDSADERAILSALKDNSILDLSSMSREYMSNSSFVLETNSLFSRVINESLMPKDCVSQYLKTTPNISALTSVPLYFSTRDAALIFNTFPTSGFAFSTILYCDENKTFFYSPFFVVMLHRILYDFESSLAEERVLVGQSRPLNATNYFTTDEANKSEYYQQSLEKAGFYEGDEIFAVNIDEREFYTEEEDASKYINIKHKIPTEYESFFDKHLHGFSLSPLLAVFMFILAILEMLLSAGISPKNIKAIFKEEQE